MGLLKVLGSLFSHEVKPSEPDASLEDISAIFNCMNRHKNDGVFVVFMPVIPREGEKDVLNIQFSIEDGTMGLDWVLLGAVNIAEKETFLNLCSQYSIDAEEKSANGCSYLRVVDGDLVAICKKSITTLYPNLSGKCLDLVLQGFNWPNA